MKAKDTKMPLFDFQEKRRIGLRQLKVSSSGVVCLMHVPIGFPGFV